MWTRLNKLFNIDLVKWKLFMLLKEKNLKSLLEAPSPVCDSSVSETCSSYLNSKQAFCTEGFVVLRDYLTY